MTLAEVSSRALPIEQIVSVEPFCVRRRIAFRDCDPAGIVYTPRFFDPIATGASDLFLAHLIGHEGARDEAVAHMGTPAKAVEFVFHKGAPLGALVDITIACSKIGARTFVLDFVGRNSAGEKLFDAALTLICIERKSFKSIPVPDHLKQQLSKHMKEA